MIVFCASKIIKVGKREEEETSLRKAFSRGGEPKADEKYFPIIYDNFVLIFLFNVVVVVGSYTHFFETHL